MQSTKMLLDDLSWDEFREHLIQDRNYKPTESNITALKSRFIIFKKYLAGKEFTVETYRQFIRDVSSNYSTASLNKFFTIAWRIDEYLVV